MRRFILAALLLLSGCAQIASQPQAATRYPDGVYRGTYYDHSTEQLAVEFEMKDQRFIAIRFIGMRYRDGDYLRADATQAQQAIVTQYEAAADYLRQKDAGALTELYQKTEIIPDVDAVTGATLKTSAVVSAIYDALSRMPYHWTQNGGFTFDTPLCDGLYRGFYYENGVERVAVAFELKDGAFAAPQLRALKDAQGAAYTEDDPARQTAHSYLSALEGKPLSALIVAAESDDALIAMLRCAIFGGLSRAPFYSEDATAFFERFLTANGTYRGHYYDQGAEQLSVQFELDNGRLHNISLRGKQESLAEGAQLGRYQQACLRLEGEPVTAISELYRLSDGSFEAGELTYAIADALARGLYKPSNASLLPSARAAADGVRRGSYRSDALILGVELRFEAGRIRSGSLTELEVNADSFGDGDEAALLLTARLAALTNQPPEEINRLYQWEHPLALPLISALWDAVEVR